MSIRRFLAVIILGIGLCCTGAWAHEELVINIPAFTLYLYDQGVPIKSYPISIGTELNPSVLAETTIINKVIDPTYYPPRGGEPISPGPENPVGTRWLGLGFVGYGIHGTNNPQSIGTPASSGCIRMQNADIEELFPLVKVGTKVQLIYQTVLIQEDPLLHTKTITVYPDVYGQGVTAAQLSQELARLNWPQVFWPPLLTLLKNPTGKPHPLAWQWPLFFNGQATDLVAAEWKGAFYVPYDQPFDPRNPLALATVKWGEEYYLPLQDYLELTGLSYSKAQGELHLHSPVAYLGEKSLGKAILFENELHLCQSGGSFNLIPTSIPLVQLWGENYQPAWTLVGQDTLAQLRLEWPDGSRSFSSWSHP